jgi:flavin-dependent dehydrogenase
MRDALVVGAGPAGCVAALVLARAGLAVTLVGTEERTAFAIGEGLPPAARAMLAALGLDARVAGQGHRHALGNRSAWGSEHIATNDFIAHPFGHGFVLDRRAFDRGLCHAARDAGANVVQGWLREVEGRAGAWRVRIDTESGTSTPAADVIVDCSGRRSAIARRQGALRVQYDRLVACAAMLETAAPGADSDATTLVEAVRDGWWYTARLPGAMRSVMFLTDSDMPAAREIRSPGGFRARLAATTHIGALCVRGGYGIASPLRMAAADTSRLDHVCGDGWLAAGDAAATFDPISSQGIVTAMQCGRNAALAILDGNVAGHAATVDATFERYDRTRAFVYAQERRWADAPFWRRRHSAPAVRSDRLDQIDGARLAR